MDHSLILEAISSTLAPLAEKAIGPGLGALFGALAAFKLERSREHRTQFRDRGTALKRTKFFLAQVRESLTTLEVRSLGLLKEDSERWKKLPVIVHGTNAIELDLNSLTFLVDLEQHTLLEDMFRCQEGFEAVRTTLHERRLAHSRFVDSLGTIRREHPNINSPVEIEELMWPSTIVPLKSLTNALYQIVDELRPIVAKTEAAIETLLVQDFVRQP